MRWKLVCALWFVAVMVWTAVQLATAHAPAERTPVTTSKVTGSPEPPTPFQSRQRFPQVKLRQPVTAHIIPGTQRLLIAQVDGKLLTLDTTRENSTALQFRDLSNDRKDLKRLYDFTFHPNFAENGFIYITYTTGNNVEDGTLVSRFHVIRRNTRSSDDNSQLEDTSELDELTLDPDSEHKLITWWAGGHNGGCLRFGPDDGYLYISTGDGTAPSPPDGKSTGQDCSDLLSSILRIDVDHPAKDGSTPYRIPADNPFVGREGIRPEIWAYGFRNPWKMDFDPVTKALWVGDVGWELWEMVFKAEAAGNYGWSVTEGPQSVRPDVPRGPTPIQPAIAAHPHTEARSVTGGVTYRGKQFPQLVGHYIYGDYVTGKIWSLDPAANPVTPAELADTAIAIITFTTTPDGEVLIVGYDGSLHELQPRKVAANQPAFPTRLSETGLFDDLPTLTPAAGVRGYHILAEPWMDGATARRHLVLPGAPTLNVHRKNNPQTGEILGRWAFPADSVLLKTLSLPGHNGNSRKVETQMLHRHDGEWQAYTYQWNDEQTDAELVPLSGRNQTYDVCDAQSPKHTRKQTWRFASRTECMVCHNSRPGFVLGFNAEQLDCPLPYVGDELGNANQLQQLIQQRYFSEPFAEMEKLRVPRHGIVDPADPSQTLEARARSYLHVNCSHCHVQGGGGTATFQATLRIDTDKLKLVGHKPTQGNFAIYDPQLIAPGDPYRSVLYYRMLTLGAGRMPHLGSSVVDAQGLQLLHDWIAAMPPLPVDPTANNAELARLTARADNVKFHRTEQQRLLARLREQDVSAVPKLLKSTSGTLQLVHALHTDSLPADIKSAALQKIRELPSHVQGLLEAFLPEDQRTKRLGDAIDVAALLQMTGDVDRGHALWHTSETVSCRNCHQVGSTGRDVGPKMDDIAKRLNQQQILESVLHPSARIEAKYLTHQVQTSAGQVHSGLLVRQDANAIVLKTADGKELTIPQAEIEQQVTAKKSLMPDLQLRDLTPQQVADLLAYLGTLKGRIRNP